MPLSVVNPRQGRLVYVAAMLLYLLFFLIRPPLNRMAVRQTGRLYGCGRVATIYLALAIGLNLGYGAGPPPACRFLRKGRYNALWCTWPYIGKTIFTAS